MAKTKEVAEPIVGTAPASIDTIEVPRETWEALIARVTHLEEQFERFMRQYKMINSTVQEIHWRFTQMAQSQS